MGAEADVISVAGRVRVRYWAAARAAAGTDAELVDRAELPAESTIADLVAVLVARRRGGEATAFARVLDVCSVLIGDRPARDPGTPVHGGESVEFLPPFAGG